MRGSAAFRLGVAPGGVLAPAWVRNALWRNAQAVPSLDLDFAGNKSLVDSVSGQNLVTFTRASSGTYAGSDGVLKTATTNLLVRSEEFDNASWATKALCTISQDSTLAPNGTTTADAIVEDTTTGFRAVGQNFTAIGSTQYTISFYVKAATRGFARVYAGSSASWSVFPSAVFNLSTGTVDSGTGFIISVGSGWYRCSVTGTFGGTGGSTQVFVGPVASSGASNSYLGTGATAIYIWGAQLEQSSTVGEYIPTTSTINSAPRFDHNPTTGESLGLLVEEQRTNLLVQSNQFDTTWTNTNSTETATSGTAPDGTNTAWQLRDTVDASAVVHSLNQTVTFTAATAYTFSVWGKAGTLDRMALVFPAVLFTNATARSCGVSFTTGVVSTGGSPTSASAVQFPNGWWRLSLTATVDNGIAAAISIRTALAGGSSYQGDGNGTILVWGAQLEAAAFPTSYIPTTTATATRSADVASITGTNFSSWYSQSEGTVFADVNSAPVNNIAQLTFDISEGAGNERMFQRRNASGIVAAAVLDNGVTQGDIGSVVIGASARYRSGYAYKLNDLEIVVNGGGSATDTSATMPTPDRLHIGQNYASGQICNGTLRRLTFWPSRLPSSTLQAITQ